jgi:hypothetical protein
MLTTAVPDTHGVDEDEIEAWMSDEEDEDEEEDDADDDQGPWQGYL